MRFTSFYLLKTVPRDKVPKVGSYTILPANTNLKSRPTYWFGILKIFSITEAVWPVPVHFDMRGGEYASVTLLQGREVYYRPHSAYQRAASV